jgi:hypothetical protein
MSRANPSFKVFSVLFGIVYIACFYYDWGLFKYYPITGEFSYVRLPPSSGPAILWYGWLGAAAVLSAAVALAVPRKVADRMWDGLLWVVPTALLTGILIYEKRWFL